MSVWLAWQAMLAMLHITLMLTHHVAIWPFGG